MDTQLWFTIANLAGSALLAYLGSWWGSYRASRRATKEAEHELHDGA